MVDTDDRNIKRIEVNADGAREKFDFWLKAGRRIGVYRNEAMDSADLGRHVFVAVGADPPARAPDGPWGTGWKYCLESVQSSLDAFDFTGSDG